MKSSSGAEGFTIVETLIVLAVTGFLLISAAFIISNKQNSTQFSQAVGDIQSQIQKVSNEVSSGFYGNNGNLQCDAPDDTQPPRLQIGSAGQGTNAACIFLGKAIQFAVDSPGSATFHIYSVVGLRETGGNPVATLAQAHPRLIARSDDDLPTVPNDTYTVGRLPYGVTVSYVHGAPSMGAVAFVSNLSNLGASDASQQVDVLAIPNTPLGQTQGAGTKSINDNLAAGTLNPASGVEICLNSGGTKQSALLTIGGQGRTTSITTVIKESLDCV